MYQYSTHNKAFSRILRRDQTDAEKKLWQQLRGRRFEGLKFHRQFPVDRYILGLLLCRKETGNRAGWRTACRKDSNAEQQAAISDAERTDQLNTLGIKVVRFWDTDVLKEIEAVLEAVRRLL